MNRSPFALKDRAQAEAYEYFDRNIRALPKSSDGKINPRARGLEDNDADAFRHAYVSGVFTLTPADKRDFKGVRTNPQTGSKTVVVLSEDKDGPDELFYDVAERTILTRLEFVAQIRDGRFLVPASNPEKKTVNNLR